MILPERWLLFVPVLTKIPYVLEPEDGLMPFPEMVLE